MFKSVVFILILLSGLRVFSQSAEVSDQQLALEYFRGKEYDKAAVLYEKLYKATNSDFYYNNLLICLREMNDFEEAEKLIRRQMKKNTGDASYHVDLGSLYIHIGKPEKGKDEFEKALKKVVANQNMISRLANAFISKREFGYAAKVYLEGRKVFEGLYGFNLELANVYFYQRNYKAMIGEYLEMLEQSPSYLQTVQNRLQSTVYNSPDENVNQLLRDGLLQKIQQKPEIIVYSELLIWLLVQDKKFDQALVQVKALDLRFNENGQRLVALARLAMEEMNYEVAIEAYNEVIQKGQDADFYFTARTEVLDAMFEQYKNELTNDRQKLLKLEAEFEKTLNEIGNTRESIELIKNLAHIKAFYLNKIEDAVKLLRTAISIRGVDPVLNASCKLELADIYVLDNNPWDAVIAYAQIEETNKNNPVGYEAKFRRARLAFFMGDFEWARAQLNVLKGSTSKLIANDACFLSVLILDNTTDDSLQIPLQMFAKADLMIYQKHDSLALLTLDSISNLYRGHSVMDETLFKKAEIFSRNGMFEEAIACYDTIANEYAWDIYADDALYNMAFLYQNKLLQPEKASLYYEKLIGSFPGSIFIAESRKQFRLLRGDVIQ